MKGFLIGLAVVVVVLVIGFTSTYNVIISKHETVAAKWAQVENQLQRRNDLIPNLVETVKGVMNFEKDTLTQVMQARANALGAKDFNDKVKAEGQLSGFMGRLLAVWENYPQLKADQTFLKLMDELSGTENRIAVERMRYNEAVKDYNITVRVFPANIVAGRFGYKPATEYFKAQDQAKTAPEVKF